MLTPILLIIIIILLVLFGGAHAWCALQEGLAEREIRKFARKVLMH